MVRLPDVHLCLIVKNEADKIEKALVHRGLFTSTLVVDTGSTDGTQEICKQLGANVVSFDWVDDFSAARNVWLDHIKEGWIFWLDADDELSEDSVSEILGCAAYAQDDVFGYVVDYEYPNGYVCDHIRLFRADRNIRWKGRIHEHLDFRKSGYGKILRAEASVQHTGYPMHDPEALEAKSRRNNELLEIELRQDPANAIIYQYIAMDHQAHARHEDAVEWFKKALKRSRTEKDFTWLPETYLNLSRSLVKLGRHEEAEDAMNDGMKRFPKEFPVFMERHLKMRLPDGRSAEDIGRSRRKLLSALS